MFSYFIFKTQNKQTNSFFSNSNLLPCPDFFLAVVVGQVHHEVPVEVLSQLRKLRAKNGIPIGPLLLGSLGKSGRQVRDRGPSRCCFRSLKSPLKNLITSHDPNVALRRGMIDDKSRFREVVGVVILPRLDHTRCKGVGLVRHLVSNKIMIFIFRGKFLLDCGSEKYLEKERTSAKKCF